MSEQKVIGPQIFGRFLCWLGFHDYRVINVTFGFSAGDSVQKVECRRCKIKTARHGQ